MLFEQIQPGSTVESRGRPVSEAEIVEFATRYDPQWFHTDAARAGASRWGGLIASGWLTCSIAMELAVKHFLGDSQSIGSPGIEQLKWLHPVRPGDELRLRMEVLESRRSRSGTTGVVRWRWLLRNQHGVVVLDLIATSLFDISAAACASSPESR
jgi:acyl dehydratase